MSNEEQMRVGFEEFLISPEIMTRTSYEPITGWSKTVGLLSWKAATASKQQEIERLETENALYAADAKRCWKLMPELSESDADYELHEAVHQLRQQLLEQAAQVEKMREALRRIATEPSCGCSFPCRCGDKEVTRIELEVRMDIANEALALTPSTALANHDNEVAAKALEYEATQLDDWHHSVAGYLRDRATERRNGK